MRWRLQLLLLNLQCLNGHTIYCFVLEMNILERTVPASDHNFDIGTSTVR